MTVMGWAFSGGGRPGDFVWMIERPEYADALFVFNDNEEQYLSYVNDPQSPSACAPGGGNAAIRPYRCTLPPRAAGIPTGTLKSGGYDALTEPVKSVIDGAIVRIRAIQKQYGYSRVFYSAEDPGGELGTGNFSVAPEVKAYITSSLRGLARSP